MSANAKKTTSAAKKRRNDAAQSVPPATRDCPGSYDLDKAEGALDRIAGFLSHLVAGRPVDPFEALSLLQIVRGHVRLAHAAMAVESKSKVA